jgi:hypothetical protein
MAIQDSAMLVNLTITQWSARKLDRSTSYEVCDAKHADHDLGRFNKQIIPKRYLKNIQQIVNKTRNYHYSNTLPWQHKGADLLPGRHYMKYVKNMGRLREKFEQAVNDFLDNYPTIIQQVQNNLNDSNKFVTSFPWTLTCHPSLVPVIFELISIKKNWIN